MLGDYLLLVIAAVVIVCSVIVLLRARGPDREATSDDTKWSSHSAVREFLNRRGRRYTWYLLAVASFLAFLVVRNLVVSHG